jgi:hypothetical protein
MAGTPDLSNIGQLDYSAQNPQAPIQLRQPITVGRRIVFEQAFRPQELDFLPWIQKGDFIFDELDNNFYWMARSEPLPAMIHAFASQADNADTGFISMDANATDLTTDRQSLFFQWFTGVKKDGFTYMQYGVGEQIFTTDKLINTSSNRARAFIDAHVSPFWSPTEYGQFFMRKGLTVAFDYFNNTGIAQVQKLRFVGRKFERALVQKGTATQLQVQSASSFPLVLTVSPADYEVVQSTARPLFMRRISGS